MLTYVNWTINWVTVSIPRETATSINGPLFRKTMLQSWQWIALILSPSISWTNDTWAFKSKKTWLLYKSWCYKPKPFQYNWARNDKFTCITAINDDNSSSSPWWLYIGFPASDNMKICFALVCQSITLIHLLKNRRAQS